MQMCGDCGKIYDESEYSKCPHCHGFGYADEGDEVIVYDKKEGRAKIVPKKDAYLYNY